MPPSPKTRILRVFLLSAAGIAFLGIYLSSFARGGLRIPCPLLLLTGRQCPACGMTRAAVSALRADFAAAFAHNALWPLGAAYLLWVWIGNAVTYAQSGECPLLPGPKWVHAIMLILAVGYGILRNVV